MLRALLTSITSTIVLASAKGQVSVEAQFGGSNFLGATINAVYDILNECRIQVLTVSNDIPC